jgi:hypothetical protein
MQRLAAKTYKLDVSSVVARHVAQTRCATQCIIVQLSDASVSCVDDAAIAVAKPSSRNRTVFSHQFASGYVAKPEHDARNDEACYPLTTAPKDCRYEGYQDRQRPEGGVFPVETLAKHLHMHDWDVGPRGLAQHMRHAFGSNSPIVHVTQNAALHTVLDITHEMLCRKSKHGSRAEVGQSAELPGLWPVVCGFWNALS